MTQDLSFETDTETWTFVEHANIFLKFLQAQNQSSFKSQSLSFKACKMYIAAKFTHLVLKLYRNKKSTIFI